ncbi:MAG: tetratricopeptide repeat protein [Saprospiraceae bacterium]|nr:tetratricopeptide repeat protein [Saprospiraceae bacterium]
MATARALTIENLNPETLIAQATTALTAAQRAVIEPLTQKLTAESTPSVLKPLSAAWHNAEHDEVAALYAQRIAEAEKTDEAWSIAGANFYLALQKATDPNLRDFCSKRAAEAFQNAASLNPTKLEHRLNLALCFVENPPADNPMKGILQLRELDSQNPENTVVNFQLARLAIKTGQFDRAITRLEKIVAKEPKNQRFICLLADAYAGKSDPKAGEWAAKCGQ